MSAIDVEERMFRRSTLFSALATCTLCIVAALGATPVGAQSKPALVRNVDEPARVPYGGTIAFSCPFTNACYAYFPVVPTGKRVHLTGVSLAMPAQSTALHLLAVHRSDPNWAGLLALYQFAPVNAAYYGSVLATTQALDLYFDAGDTPIVELGVPAATGGISSASARVTLSGYIVDVTP